jgi:hypothetical protein
LKVGRTLFASLFVDEAPKRIETTTPCGRDLDLELEMGPGPALLHLAPIIPGIERC